MHGDGRHKIVVGEPEGQRPLGTYRHKWGDNITIDEDDNEHLGSINMERV
jgi:hypothetical protein